MRCVSFIHCATAVATLTCLALAPVAQAQILYAISSSATPGASDTVSTFTPNGIQSTFATVPARLLGLAVDGSGNVFVSAIDSHSIIKITPGGTQSTFASGIVTPAGLRFDSSGNLYVADNGSGNIFKITPGGVKSTFITGLSSPYDEVFDSSGNTYVTDTNAGSIYKFTPGGMQSTFARLPLVFQLAVDSSDNLYVGPNHYSDSILKFTPGGTQSTFASGLGFIDGLAFDPGGNLFASTQTTTVFGQPTGVGNLFKFTPGGTQSTFASGTPLSYLAFGPAAVPEPGSLALLVGLGISGAGFVARRRKSVRKAA